MWSVGSVLCSGRGVSLVVRAREPESGLSGFSTPSSWRPRRSGVETGALPRTALFCPWLWEAAVTTRDQAGTWVLLPAPLALCSPPAPAPLQSLPQERGFPSCNVGPLLFAASGTASWNGALSASTPRARGSQSDSQPGGSYRPQVPRVTHEGQRRGAALYLPTRRASPSCSWPSRSLCAQT